MCHLHDDLSQTPLLAKWLRKVLEAYGAGQDLTRLFCVAPSDCIPIPTINSLGLPQDETLSSKRRLRSLLENPIIQVLFSDKDPHDAEFFAEGMAPRSEQLSIADLKVLLGSPNDGAANQNGPPAGIKRIIFDSEGCFREDCQEN